MNLEAQAQGGQNATVGTGKGGESADEGKFSYAFHVLAANTMIAVSLRDIHTH